ncbi:MAG: hypothetical protein AABX11_06335 [Nanoarchaeota archaeon]
MKRVLILLFAVILLSSLSCALSINSSKSIYQPGETAVVSFKGNFLESINKNQVEVKRNNVIVPVDYLIQGFEGEYAVVFITPTLENNYTLWINDASYVNNGVQITSDLSYNFSVNGTTKDYYVKPGTLNPKEEFFVIVYSNLDDSINLNVNFTESYNKEIKPGENKIYFPVDKIFGIKKMEITLGEYKIPFLVAGSLTHIQNLENIYGLRISPLEIDKKLTRTSSFNYSITLTNNGKEDLEEISVKYDSEDIILSPVENFTLGSGESKEFTLKLKRFENYSGEITFRYSNVTIEIPVIFVIEEIGTGNNQSLNGSGIDKSQYFCEELGGIICIENEECSGDSVVSLNGRCCMSTCKASSGGFGSSIWGWILIILVLGVIGFLIWKYKKAPESETKGTMGSMKRDLPISKKNVP